MVHDLDPFIPEDERVEGDPTTSTWVCRNCGHRTPIKKTITNKMIIQELQRRGNLNPSWNDIETVYLFLKEKYEIKIKLLRWNTGIRGGKVNVLPEDRVDNIMDAILGIPV